MAHVITRKYSQYFDIKNNIQFTEILDKATGTKIGHAQTDVDYSERRDFQVLTDLEFAQMISGVNLVRAAPVMVTGDPLGDEALLGDPVRGRVASLLSDAPGDPAGDIPVVNEGPGGDPLGDPAGDIPVASEGPGADPGTGDMPVTSTGKKTTQ